MADAAGIQFRMLNASKGPAVRGPRAQMDRQLYKHHMQRHLAAVPRLEIVDDAVTNILLESASNSSRSTAGVMLASGDSVQVLHHVVIVTVSSASLLYHAWRLLTTL